MLLNSHVVWPYFSEYGLFEALLKFAIFLCSPTINYPAASGRVYSVPASKIVPADGHYESSGNGHLDS